MVDGRKCISYLTIENDEAIPLVYRKAMGNRVYGCDDCQLICPWNKYAEVTEEKDFFARQHMHNRSLLDLFKWTEEEFLNYTEGSAIRRIGYKKWQRNIAVGLGNQVPKTMQEVAQLKAVLQSALGNCDDMVDEHIQWALNEVAQYEHLGMDASSAESAQRSELTKSADLVRSPLTEVTSGQQANPANAEQQKIIRKTERLTRSIEKGMPKHQ